MRSESIENTEHSQKVFSPLLPTILAPQPAKKPFWSPFPDLPLLNNDLLDLKIQLQELKHDLLELKNDYNEFKDDLPELKNVLLELKMAKNPFGSPFRSLKD